MNDPSADTLPGLLAVIERLVTELRPGARVRVEPGSSLEKDLGLDSLARMELLHRIEAAFSVRLPEAAMIDAETPNDLLRALKDAGAAAPLAAPLPPPVAPPSALAGLPDTAQTLVDVLDWHVERHADRSHICFYRSAEEAETINYGELRARASTVAAALVAHGVQPGQTVAIMLPTSLEFFYSYYGALIAGGVPVPIYPPARLSQLEDHMRRQSGILDSAQAVLLITVAQAKPLVRFLRASVKSLRDIVTADELLRAKSVESVHLALRAGDTAFIQYTSGSTGNPKGVVLTHANLLANIRAWGKAVEIAATDVAVSWLPLYHDMGLIGAWMGSLYHGGLLVLMSPLDFLARPERWLQLISRHRGTITAAPNFAFELCLRRVKDEDLAGVDLSSWRLCANGAEPVSPDTITRFAERFARYGFRDTAMAPVYGLAECTVGVAVPPLNRKPIIDRVQRDALIRTGQALPAAPEDAHPLRFVACGRALPGHDIRIVDAQGHELPERATGRLQFRGPSATSGYFRNLEETTCLTEGEWYNTGDMAYIAAGDLYLTSRVKDMIIRGGHNLYPYELEEAVGDLPGIRKGCVAVVGVPDAASGTEKLVVIAETRERDTAVREHLTRKINAAAIDIFGGPVDDVALVPPYAVLKTSSGKIRRAATRENYLNGAIHAPQRAARWQFVRLASAGLLAQSQLVFRSLGRGLYAAYASFWFVIIAPIAWLASALLPKPWVWSFCRLCARLFFRLAGLYPKISGASGLPKGAAYVLVANHGSYLDGILLVAMLPEPVRFVAKREFAGHFVSNVFFVNLGAEYVERFDRREAVDHARQLTERVRAGARLGVFPEGTFTRRTGLNPFRMGAFVTAADAGVPVVPVAIRGAREVLCDKSWILRHGPITLNIGTAIPAPASTDWQGALALRDAARAHILKHCGEPDLA